jgi:tetratricopeptide (TPR) repeat protein
VLRLDPRSAAAYVQLARLELMRGKPAASAQMATSAITQDPDNAVARLILARALLAQRRPAEARPELDRLEKAYPKAAPVQVQIGMERMQVGDARGARAAFERALALDASAGDALAALTSLDVRQGKGAAARARLGERIAKAPTDASLRVLDARAALAMRQPDQAIAQLRAAVEAEPNRLDAYALLAQVYLAQGKLDEARAECDAIAARQPRDVASRTLAAIISEVQGKTADAITRYEQIVRLDPRAAVASNNLAWQYAQAGTNLSAALQLAQAARAQLPERPEVLDTLGEVFLRQKQPSLALAPLRDAVERAPDNPAYRARLGRALADAGQPEAARRELEQALKSGQDFPGAAEARAALSKLGH